MRSNHVVGFLILAVSVAPCAAVELASDERGGAVIAPMFNANNDHATLITLSNATSESGIATKLRLRDRTGAELAVANLYLGPLDTWVGSLVADEGGGAVLHSSDPSCVLTGSGSGIAAISEIAIAQRSGYVEIVEMGSAEEASLIDEIRTNNCAALVERWVTGAWAGSPNVGLGAPSDATVAVIQIVNVDLGTLYGPSSTYLRGFSDIPQHSEPSSPVPDLSSAHDPGTATGATWTRICTDEGCFEDTWSEPVDAVAAVLTVHELRGEYSVNSGLAAKADVVFLNPMRRYYESGLLTSSTFDILVIGRDAALVRESCVPTPGPQSDFCGFPGRQIFLTTAQYVVGFNDDPSDFGETQDSQLLGIERVVAYPEFDDGAPEEGIFRLGMETGGSDALLTANSGRKYVGWPMIGEVFQQYENGVLMADDGAQQRANYGATATVSRRSRVR